MHRSVFDTNILRTLIATLVAVWAFCTSAARSMEFRCLDINNGLADSHISCITKDRQGFLWIGTAAGLCRYDGFRFKNFYSNPTDKSSIPSNQINEIQVSADGKLLVKTDNGYCIYNPVTESFDQNIAAWMRDKGMSGKPNRIFIDSKGDFWVAVNGKGCYYYSREKKKAYLFGTAQNADIGNPGYVTDITERDNSLVVSYDNGLLVRLDGKRHKVVWTNRHIAECNKYRKHYYRTYIDSQYNYWVSNYSTGHTWVYSSAQKKWYYSPSAFLASLGIGMDKHDIFVNDIKEDAQHNLWIASERHGLFVANIGKRQLQNHIHNNDNPNSIPDNTLRYIYIDPSDAVWIGSYNNGVAYYSPTLSHFPTIKLGDICTIAVDRKGNYWCGTNNDGIVCLQPGTGSTRRYGMKKNGLGSDVVVSSLCTADGTLWFGTFNGGLAHYANDKFTVYRAASGLANDCVWSLTEDNKGNIILGTLGAGVQCLDPRRGTFTNYNTSNSGIPSDYVSSVKVDSHGRYIVGHSVGVTVVDPKTRKSTDIPPTSSATGFSSLAVNDICIDRRGLLWNANMSGLDVYDFKTQKVTHVFNHPQMVCAVAEDAYGNIWATLPNCVVRVKVGCKGGEYTFFTSSFDELDGLQKRRFNYRSISKTRNGEIVIGGQDGINVIASGKTYPNTVTSRALFSEVVLYDHILSVGEKYNRRIILDKAVNASHELRLNHDENAFTVLLASDNVTIPEKKHFLYRLKGFANDNWFMTVESQPSVTYTNLHSGRYVLQVRVVEKDGRVSDKTEEMAIIVNPPLWLSWWAYIIYAVLAAGIVWLVWYLTIHRQMTRLRIEQIQRDAERKRKLDEMKLSFLTDISHELRTPLALVISPIEKLAANEDDGKKRSMLELVLRNAKRLLTLVNQTLDLRKIETRSMELEAKKADIVKFVSDTTTAFSQLSQKSVSFAFHTDADSLAMAFDADKMSKVLNNLLSNAVKFTPAAGKVTVSVRQRDTYVELPVKTRQVVEIAVADTGCGISDADKLHIFDRFYQVNNHMDKIFGGSGLGLNIAKEYVAMHGGTISVTDNHENGGKGTVFTVMLPVAEDNTSTSPLNGNATDESAQNDGDAITPTAGQGKLNRKREVLIVDDSEDFLSFMSEILSTQYTVRTAVNGKEALSEIAKHRPDAILSDVMMPVMDGNALCKAVKENRDTCSIPFIMLTARISTECKIEGFGCGADEYITKPFNLDLLNMRISKLIESCASNGTKQAIVPTISEEQVVSADQQLIDRATAYVEKRLSDPDLSVEALSEALGMSRVNMYKRLLSVTGSTPSEFIRNIRLRHAEQLLREGSLNVSEVAYKVGFNQPRIFSKYFKDFYGILPSALTRKD